MPWSGSRMDDRMKFIAAWKSRRWSMDELCTSFAISRKTAYKTLARFQEFGAEGLEDRSRARLTQNLRTPAAIERRIVEAARRWGCWGPRKVRVLLKRRAPEIEWPAKSTIADILKRHGLTKPRGSRRRRVELLKAPRFAATRPNDLWATDFKGWCLSGARERLEPFALNDVASRFSLACQLVKHTSIDAVWPIFERSFREHGLPRGVLSDNGPPFGSRGLAGLSRLAIRLVRLDVRPVYIDPGKPQQNGALERFHFTVEIEAMRPPARTRVEQQRVLDRFRWRYNHVRPHEALNDRAPADVYVSSSRRFSGEVPEIVYEPHVVVRVVQSNGVVKWAGREFFLSETLGGECIGFEQISSRHWSIRLGPLEVALFDDETRDLIGHRRLVWCDDPDED